MDDPYGEADSLDGVNATALKRPASETDMAELIHCEEGSVKRKKTFERMGDTELVRLVDGSHGEASAITSLEQTIRIERLRHRKKVKPTEEQLKTTEESRLLRRTFMDAIQDAMCSNEQFHGSVGASMASILTDFEKCIKDRLFTFATRRLPEGAKMEDVSRESELEEFARWWLFGVTALLFSIPKQEAQKHFLKAKSVLSCLCQLLHHGHPAIVDRIGVEFFQLLKDLLVRSDDTAPLLKLTLSRGHADSDGKKIFRTNVPIIENNEWIIPHYIHAVSPLITRICLHNVKLFHLFTDTLRRLVVSRTTPETVETVLASFPSFVLTDAHSCYLTENAFVSMMQKILEAPSLSKTDVAKIGHLFSQYDFPNSQFAGLLQDSGMGLLRMGINDFLYSDKFALSCKNDFNQAIVQAFKFIIEGSQRSARWTEAEVMPLIRMISTKGLETILHPLLEQMVLSEMLSYDYCEGEELKPRNASKAWNSIFQVWEESLNLEYRALLSSSGENVTTEEAQLATVSFFSSTAALTKLVSRLRVQLRKNGLNDKVEFFHLKHLQQWSDVTFQVLANVQKLKATKLPQIYSGILDTLQNLDSCNWFGTTLSTKFINNLICIPGWLWLPLYDCYIPQRLKPLPEFTMKFNGSELQFIRGSSLLTSKAIGTLRLEVFRPWRCLVTEIYISIMEAPTTLSDPFLVIELLCAIAAVSWVFKEAIPLKATFTFMDKLIRTDLWKGYSGVRASLALAINALPCICHYNYLRSRSSNNISLVSRSGCEKEKCQTFVPLPPECVDERPNENEDLKDDYIKAIVQLVVPLLKSKFLLLRITMSDLIISCHNHVHAPSAAIIIPMIEVAVHGHLLVCEEIFRKIGLIVANAAPNSLDADIAKTIFSYAIPRLCKLKLASSKKRILSLSTREKITKGLLCFSTAGALGISVFVHVLKCIIYIVSQTNETRLSPVLILSQRIVRHFAESNNCQPHQLMNKCRQAVSKYIVDVGLQELFPRNTNITVEQVKLSRFIDLLEKVAFMGGYGKQFCSYIYPPILEIVIGNISKPKYQSLLTALSVHDKTVERSLLKKYLQDFVPSLLLDNSPEQIVNSTRMINNAFKFDLLLELAHNPGTVLYRTLLRLWDRKNKVLELIPLLCTFEDKLLTQLEMTGTSTPAPSIHLSDLFGTERLQGFLVYVDGLLESKIESCVAKQNWLCSLAILIGSLNKFLVSNVGSEIYNTVVRAMDHGGLDLSLVLHVWREFVKKLDDRRLLELMVPVLASIQSLRNSPKCSLQVDAIASYFVCGRKELTGPNHCQLHFLLGKCKNVGVLDAISRSITSMKENDWSLFYDMVLMQAKSCFRSERAEGFLKILCIHREEWELVENHVFSRGVGYVSGIVSVLIGGLLQAQRSGREDDTRNIILSCIGSIGALDPSRFRRCDDDLNYDRNLASALSVSCNIHTFAILYLNELVRELIDANTQSTFDSCSQLIRIVLTDFNVRANENDSIWRNLSTSKRNMILPLFAPIYGLESEPKIPTVLFPIYMSKHGNVFQEWLSQWTLGMVSILKPSQRAHSLFRKSVVHLSRSSRIAAFIAPFLAMNAVICATPAELETIRVEIVTILDRCIYLEEMEPSYIMETRNVQDIESKTEGLEPILHQPADESHLNSKCLKIILPVVDHLMRTANSIRKSIGLSLAAAKSSRQPTQQSTQLKLWERELAALETVLRPIPHILLSKAYFRVADYAAALYFLEEHLRRCHRGESVQENGDYIQRLYTALGDKDSACEIDILSNFNPSPVSHLVKSKMLGKTSECVKQLQLMAAGSPDDCSLHRALVRGYLDLHEPHNALTVIEATLAREPCWEFELLECQVESLVHLQRWADVDQTFSSLSNLKEGEHYGKRHWSWTLHIAEILSKMERQEPVCGKVLDLKEFLYAPLSEQLNAVYQYRTMYPYVTMLHIVSEVEDVASLMDSFDACRAENMAAGRAHHGYDLQSQLFRLANKWEKRLKNVSSSRQCMDQILHVRTCLFRIIKKRCIPCATSSEIIDECISNNWMKSARAATRCGEIDRADNCLQEAKQFQSLRFVIEEAKFLVHKGEKENAASKLKLGLSFYNPTVESANMKCKSPLLCSSTPNHLSKTRSKALLMLTKISRELKLWDIEEYVTHYESAIATHESENSLFAMGHFYDQLLSGRENSPFYFDTQAKAVKYFSKSLSFGCKHIYQSLPRLLAIWLDFAAGLYGNDSQRYGHTGLPLTPSSEVSCAGSNASSPWDPEQCLESMHSSISNMLDKVPSYTFLTALNQLLSRICHSHEKTWTLLKTIIVSVISEYPMQTLWSIMAVEKSVNPKRKSRSAEILRAVAERNPDLCTPISHHLQLAEGFIDLCKMSVPENVYDVSLMQTFAQLPHLNRIITLGRILIPFQRFLKPILPRKAGKEGRKGKGDGISRHFPFAESPVCFSSIADNVSVMNSMARPKKITVRGENGKTYGLLFKPDDNLRKDSKVYEISTVLNHYMETNVECSHRSLNVKTYAVVPLTEYCGIMEWVPELVTLRHAVASLYLEKNINYRRPSGARAEDSLAVKQEKFLLKLKEIPPVLREWFFTHFPDYQSWYYARMCYTRSVAVTSIVGYMLGLGDRHSENILLDKATGSVVHVDFSCLFNKGETLRFPERVPFRLTQNMIDAMGILGKDGAFRKTCELVVRLCREHKDEFLSLIGAFLHDPLIEWKKDKTRPASTLDSGEYFNPDALDAMRRLRSRLVGTARNTAGVIDTELSPSAQVAHLINEATSISNLSQMYIGWGAFL